MHPFNHISWLYDIKLGTILMFSNISIQEASATFFTVIMIYVKSVIPYSYFDELYTDTRTEYNHRVRHGCHITRKTDSQCVLQNLWLYEHGSGCLLPEWFQARTLHEDPSKIDVLSSGEFSLLYLTSNI